MFSLDVHFPLQICGRWILPEKKPCYGKHTIEIMIWRSRTSNPLCCFMLWLKLCLEKCRGVHVSADTSRYKGQFSCSSKIIVHLIKYKSFNHFSTSRFFIDNNLALAVTFHKLPKKMHFRIGDQQARLFWNYNILL